MFCLVGYQPLSGVSDYIPLSNMFDDSVQFAAESDFAVGIQRLRFGSRPRRLMIPTYLSCLVIKLMMGW